MVARGLVCVEVPLERRVDARERPKQNRLRVESDQRQVAGESSLEQIHGLERDRDPQAFADADACTWRERQLPHAHAVVRPLFIALAAVEELEARRVTDGRRGLLVAKRDAAGPATSGRYLCDEAAAERGSRPILVGRVVQ